MLNAKRLSVSDSICFIVPYKHAGLGYIKSYYDHRQQNKAGEWKAEKVFSSLPKENATTFLLLDFPLLVYPYVAVN